jgi:hypothetical protein
MKRKRVACCGTCINIRKKKYSEGGLLSPTLHYFICNIDGTEVDRTDICKKDYKKKDQNNEKV